MTRAGLYRMVSAVGDVTLRLLVGVKVHAPTAFLGGIRRSPLAGSMLCFSTMSCGQRQ